MISPQQSLLVRRISYWSFSHLGQKLLELFILKEPGRKFFVPSVPDFLQPSLDVLEALDLIL